MYAQAKLPLISIVFSLSCAITAEARPVGQITRIVGNVTVEEKAISDNSALGLPLHSGDKISTGANARLELKLRDGSVITLGENTQFRIQKYNYSPRRGIGQALFDLVKGVFRAVSGAISHVRKPVFEVHTTHGMIGIRGTDFWGGFHFGNELSVLLFNGRGVYVRNMAGMVELTQIGEGTNVKSQTIAPEPVRIWGQNKIDAAQASVAWPIP